MKKIPTLFIKDPEDLSKVLPEIDPRNFWIFNGAIATRKLDGTACAVINGKLYKRFDAKRNKDTGEWKQAPEGSIPCQEPDPISGHHPHWTPVTEQDKWHLQAFSNDLEDGTYELIGERINRNPEKINGHVLMPHGSEVLFDVSTVQLTYEWLKQYLEGEDIEGIVFYSTTTDDMCKIRKKDFGLRR